MDILHDNNWFDLVCISEKIGEDNMPSYIREYTPMEKENASLFSDEQFADDIDKMFPIDCKENAWLSAAYFGHNEPILRHQKTAKNYIKHRIVKAAEIYGIKDDVENVFEKIAERPKKNVSSIMLKDASGKEISAYPIQDSNSLNKAAEYFDTYRFRYTPTQRHEIAAHIIKSAMEQRADLDNLPKSVKSDGGYGIPNKSALMEEILDRAQLSKDAELTAALGNINIMLGELPTLAEEGVLSKLAEVVNEFDSATGIDKRVLKNKYLPIEDIIYSESMDKVADDIEDAVKINKYTFSLTKLAELGLEPFDTILGEGFVEKVSSDGVINKKKLANELNKLDVKDKNALEQHICGTY